MAEGAVVYRTAILFLSEAFFCKDQNEHAGDDE
jgi:hypothetical protein